MTRFLPQNVVPSHRKKLINCVYGAEDEIRTFEKPSIL